MGFNYTRDEVMQMSMNSSKRKLDEIERRLAVVEKKLASDFRENVHGKWIDTGSWRQCSVCKEVQYGYDNFRNFCPNCGADMRKGE